MKLSGAAKGGGGWGLKSTESTWQKNIYTILKMEKFTQKIDTILDTESKLREVGKN